MIELKVDDREIVTALEKLAAKGQNLRPAMLAISHDMRDAVKQRFIEGPATWKKLAKSTVKRYEKKGWSTQPTLNRNSGGLFPSIVPDNSGSTATVGTNKIYAAVHHFGKTINRPERQQVIHFKQEVRGKITRATRNAQGKLQGGDKFSKAKGSRYVSQTIILYHQLTENY